MERDKKQNTLLVGSLNAANKYTIGRGKMQKLSGIIITKNIDPDRQRMPTKVKLCFLKSIISILYYIDYGGATELAAYEIRPNI